MKDIGTLIKENGHQGKNLLLKMDIEGFEYPAIQALTEKEISQFTQISIEMHDLQNLLFDAEKHFQSLFFVFDPPVLETKKKRFVRRSACFAPQRPMQALSST